MVLKMQGEVSWAQNSLNAHNCLHVMSVLHLQSGDR